MRANARPGAPIVVSQGDPAGIGAEVILKAASELGQHPDAPNLVVLGDLAQIRETAQRLGNVPDPYEWRPGERTGDGVDTIAVMGVGELSRRARRPGRPSVEGASAAYDYIIAGAQMALGGQAAGLVTGPINKQWLNRAGHHFPGHSEMLAKLAHARLWRMMFAGDQLLVALVTVHMGLAKVSRALTEENVFDTITLLASHLRHIHGLAHPKIGVLGFNPHAGEQGLFGNEEISVIEPAIKRARRRGIGVLGPLPPDTAFIREGGRFRFDAAVAMYHDQGLIPLKTLEFERAVNVTLGLPFVRTSPDHGTAYDIAGSGTANPSSMIAAIDYARRATNLRSARRPARKSAA